MPVYTIEVEQFLHEKGVVEVEAASPEAALEMARDPERFNELLGEAHWDDAEHLEYRVSALLFEDTNMGIIIDDIAEIFFPENSDGDVVYSFRDLRDYSKLSVDVNAIWQREILDRIASL